MSRVLNDIKTNDEVIQNWWYDLSDHDTEKFIMRHGMKKPIDINDIRKIHEIEVK